MENNSPVDHVLNSSPFDMTAFRALSESDQLLVFRHKFDTDQKWVERGIVALYNEQTNDEKNMQETRHNNNRGFSGFTAKSGTYYATWILKGNSLNGRFVDKARKIVQHHAKQIVRLALEGK